MKRVRVGLSGEGREIWGVRITSTPEGPEDKEYDWEEELKNFGIGEVEEEAEELQPVIGQRDSYDYDPEADVGFSDGEEEWDWEVEVMNEDGSITWERIFNESMNESIPPKTTRGKKNKGADVKKGFLITGAQHAREVRPIPFLPHIPNTLLTLPHSG